MSEKIYSSHVPLANDYITVFESPDASTLYCYSPGLARLDNGRLIATLDLREAHDLPGPKFERIGGYGQWWQGKVYTSDNGGKTWRHRVDFPFMHARPFVAGNYVYVLGQADDLTIMRSGDGGETWSPPARLTQGEQWGQAPSNVHHANDSVYLTMASASCVVLMRGRTGTDLTHRENWTFASMLDTRRVVETLNLDGFGVPFRETQVRISGESHVVQFLAPNHVWFDPAMKTFHIWARVNHGGTGYAAILKVVEQGDTPGTGPMETMLERAPSGNTILFVPLPGGHLKFHILYDKATELFWLLSSQPTDSMIRPECMSADRYRAPSDERHRLVLHFSRNMMDWCFAGIVSTGGSPREARSYASMAIDGDDLLILSRSGDQRAKSAHDGNLITFHRLKKFRTLIY